MKSSFPWTITDDELAAGQRCMETRPNSVNDTTSLFRRDCLA